MALFLGPSPLSFPDYFPPPFLSQINEAEQVVAAFEQGHGAEPGDFLVREPETWDYMKGNNGNLKRRPIHPSVDGASVWHTNVALSLPRWAQLLPIGTE